MTRERTASPETRALLDHEREVPPLPAAMRARAVARARAALVAGARGRDPASRSRRDTRWAAAAALIGILGGGVGAAAYQFRAYLAPAPETPANNRPAAPPQQALRHPAGSGRAGAGQVEEAPRRALGRVGKPVLSGPTGPRRASPRCVRPAPRSRAKITRPLCRRLRSTPTGSRMAA